MLIIRTLRFQINIKTMTQFLKTVATIAFLALTSKSAFAAGTLYVYFDAACMDRMEYSDAAGGKFIAYQINTSTSEKIGLVIGTENPNPAAQLPPQTLHCGNTIFDQRFVQAVNQRLTEVYMVRPSGDGRYHITKVAYATHFGNSPDLMVYQSPKAQFSFQTNAGIIGENISLNKAVNAVLFEGRIENACTGEYIFSVTSTSGAGPFSSLVIAPEIGLVEERSGPNIEEAMRNVLRLDRVNDRPVSEYLRIVCRGERPVPVTSGSPIASDQQQLTPRSGETPVPAENAVPPSYDQTTAQPIVVQPAPASPCAEASGNGFHVVQKGDNLYRISQAYGISVAQLRELNGVSATNTIYPCQKLRVAAATQQATPPSYSAERLTPKSGQVLPTWQASSGTHTVQPGETVAAIAMKYGYTEYRFRYFNGLGDNEPARVGQALKTSDCEIQTIGATVQPPKQSAYENVLTPRTPAVAAENTGAGKIRSVSTVAASATETELTSTSWKTAATSAATYTPPANMPAPYGNETAGSRLSSGLSARMQGNETAVPSSYDSSNTTTTGKRVTHLVGKDETLFDIARRYNTTTENLRRLNTLHPGEAVIPGQRLYVN
jgi:LysM repeat protein